MSTPADQLPMQPPPQSALDQYMSQYGEQLQSMLAGDPSGGTAPPAADPGMAAAGQTSNLGPDLYRPAPVNIPQQSALAGPRGQGGGSAAPQGPAPSGGQQSALDDGKGGGAPGQGDGLSFRDLFSQQSQATRDKYVKQLQDHLKQADQTIDSAYSDMMTKMGGRPDKDLSKNQKGMLLMEFGMRMMEHSQGKYGQTNGVGGAIGQSGVETLQSAKGMMATNAGQQQHYDQMQEQLTIAQGKEKAQLASRSALEEGRDARAYGQQNSMLDRVQMQQAGAGARNTDRIQGQADRTDTTETGKNRRAALAAGQVKRTVTGDDGSMYGVTGNGSLVSLESDGKTIKANPGGGSGGGKQTAAQANFGLYMSTYGKDKDGKPLEGEDMQAAQAEALKYAANPRTYQLSDAQARQMAEKSADSFIRANPTSWLGMAPDEVESTRAAYAEKEFNRIKRGGGANPTPPPRTSALEGGGSTGRTPTRPGAGATGNIPAQPPQGSKGPNSAQLQLLSSNPKQNAKPFLAKFGYLPKEYQSFAQQQSALSQ